MALAGAYLGGASANGTLNPTKWDYNSPTTWVGIGTGALMGAGADPVADNRAFGVLAATTGHSTTIATTRELVPLIHHLNNDGRAILNLNLPGDVGHAVVVTSISTKVISKPNGTFKIRPYVIGTMDPATGLQNYFGERTLNDATRLYYISR
jgi:hypothetical protein